MGGVTPHGIRYPDGASKAKNLGPELKTMAEDIDWYIGSYLSPTGPIRQIIIGVAEEVVPPIVQRELDDVGVVSAIPKRQSVTSSRTTMPIGWMERALVTTYPDVYPDVIPGVWTEDRYREKSIPFVSDVTGRIPEQTISESIARVSQVPTAESIRAQIEGALTGVQSERRVRRELPIFGARVAVGATENQPVAIGIASSSTFARNPGPGVRLVKMIQSAYPVDAQTTMQFSADADFTRLTSPGIHAYNAGQGGTRSDNYLTDAESDKLAALDLAMLLHVVGANDYTNQIDPATYRTNIENRLDYLDGQFPGPCQHVLVHAYARLAFTPPSYPNSAYGDALKAIAADRTNCVFVDYSEPFAEVGVPGNDPMNLIDTDNIHPTDRGNRFIADLVSAAIVI